MRNVGVLPPINTKVRVALMSLAAFKGIPNAQLMKAARALPGGTKVDTPDRLTAIVLLLGTRPVGVN